MVFSFIHAADIHLDSPLRGLSSYEGAPVQELRSATRQALLNLVKLATDERVAFVLLAGDLYDGDWKDYNTGLFLHQQMAHLQQAGIAVFLISGNHDAAAQMTKSLHLPDNVHLFPHRKPTTVRRDDLGVAIHGQSYAARETTGNLATGYPDPIPGLLNIGMLHTSVNGRPGHDAYAPCTVEDLLAKHYEYWALGHVHTREVLHKDPWIIFPGNTQGRHIREIGAKGCTLVTVADGEISEVEHRDLDVLRWQLCPVDLTGVSDVASVLDRIGDSLSPLCAACDHPLAVRFRLSGTCTLHPDLIDHIDHWESEVRAMATDCSSGRVWVEEIRAATQMPQDDAPTAGHDAVRELLTAILSVAEDEEQVAALAGQFNDLTQKLPYELTHGEEGLLPTDPAILRAAIAEAHTVLTARLRPAGGIA